MDRQGTILAAITREGSRITERNLKGRYVAGSDDMEAAKWQGASRLLLTLNENGKKTSRTVQVP